MSSVRPVGVLLLLFTIAAAVVATLVARPAGAATVTVQVIDNAYSPPVIDIVAGDTVQWAWVGRNPHSVSFAGGPDSHPDCVEASRESCSRPGDPPYVRTFPEAGEFTYLCRIHGLNGGMTGTVRVAPAPRPSPAPTGQPPLPTSTETTPPSEPTASPSPTTSPTGPPAPPASPSPSEPASPPPPEPSPTPEPPPVEEGSPSPSPSPSPPPRQLPPPAPRPSGSPVPRDVAPPSDFAPFPTAEPIETPSDGDAADEVAVSIPGDDGPSPLLLTIATLSVVGTAIAFGSTVLFGPPWLGP